jgi:hypothetical protein
MLEAAAVKRGWWAVDYLHRAGHVPKPSTRVGNRAFTPTRTWSGSARHWSSGPPAAGKKSTELHENRGCVGQNADHDGALERASKDPDEQTLLRVFYL